LADLPEDEFKDDFRKMLDNEIANGNTLAVTLGYTTRIRDAPTA
jgi:hypothetical protein